jgi:hypothetical protein
MQIPIRYLPSYLSNNDKTRQINAIKKSRKLYKKHTYYKRPSVASFKNTHSKHIQKAKQIYGVEKIVPSLELVNATGCSMKALQKIVNKGEGAYYSSGSRPNQTAQSWGFARLASSITAGKSASIDYDILEKGCNHQKRAFKLANQSRKRYKMGHSHTKRINI